jgi:hypothetical protein
MVFKGAHVVYLMAFSYNVHGELITYSKATLQCLVIVFMELTVHSWRLPHYASWCPWFALNPMFMV